MANKSQQQTWSGINDESGRKAEKGGREKVANPLICILVSILILGVAVMDTSAFWGFGNSVSWKEEVLLHDGTKIVVERFYHLAGKPTLDSRERRALDETVSFILPGSNNKVTWKTDFRDSASEPNSLNLLVLDIINGTPYIATHPAGCIAYNKWKRPNPPYIFFKYDGNDWKRIPLEEFPTILSKVNVIVGRPPAEVLKLYYTVEQGINQNKDIHTEIYKTIIREPLHPDSLGVSCPDWSSPKFTSPKAPFPIKIKIKNSGG